MVDESSGARQSGLTSETAAAPVPPAKRAPLHTGTDSAPAGTRTDANGDTIEEYSRNGSVYMVRIKPKHGVTQTYMVNEPGSNRMHDPKLGPVSPVYYDIYKWGGPKKPAGNQEPAQASSSG